MVGKAAKYELQQYSLVRDLERIGVVEGRRRCTSGPASSIGFRGGSPTVAENGVSWSCLLGAGIHRMSVSDGEDR